jgi:formylglycine-generating enzyme required for sulfatase activity
MNDIFISYANEDLDRIRSLAAALEAKGWSVFYDRTIPNGKTWRDVIGKGLRDSRCVVVAWSTTSIESTWVQEEADEGRERGILHPVLIDHVKAPLGFRAIQAANLVGWNVRNPSPEFDRFLKDLEGRLGPPRPGTSQPPPAETPPQKEAEPPARENHQSQRYILIGVGLLLAVGALAAYGILSQSQGPPPVTPIVKSDEPPPKQSQETTPPPAPTPTVTPKTTEARTTVTKPQPIAGPAKNITGKDGAPMVLVPAGEFMMGSREDDKGARNDERPAHPVYLEDFSIDQYEVTTSRYATFFQKTKRTPPEHWSEQILKEHGRKPVVGVDWDDAQAYCAWMGKRLPTEAEWEKSARGTDRRIYPWGNTEPSQTLANFNHCCDFKNYGALTDVGSFDRGKSPYGVYDMAGNVLEWVADWYDENYYGMRPDRNPKGPSSGQYRVLRGGTWFNAPVDVRSANRYWLPPSLRNDSLGFRCAQDSPK